MSVVSQQPPKTNKARPPKELVLIPKGTVTQNSSSYSDLSILKGVLQVCSVFRSYVTLIRSSPWAGTLQINDALCAKDP